MKEYFNWNQVEIYWGLGLGKREKGKGLDKLLPYALQHAEVNNKKQDSWKLRMWYGSGWPKTRFKEFELLKRMQLSFTWVTLTYLVNE